MKDRAGVHVRFSLDLTTSLDTHGLLHYMANPTKSGLPNLLPNIRPLVNDPEMIISYVLSLRLARNFTTTEVWPLTLHKSIIFKFLRNFSRIKAGKLVQVIINYFENSYKNTI